ncbi:MAG: Clp protease N-terminal domain-containing protein, partial [Bacteroidales bacterium]|nr:Clp protease N-terminal domain-containing protein [Bacteroidales bacterium]
MQINISESLNVIIRFAREEAMRTGSYSIGPDHLFLAIVRHGDNPACECLKALEVDLQELKQFIDSRIFTNEHIPYSDIAEISGSRSSHDVISICVLEATRFHTTEALPVHLLLALCRAQDCYGRV